MTTNHDPAREDIQDDEVIGQAFRRSMLAIAAIVCLLAVGFVVSRLWKPNQPELVETEITLPQERRVAEVELPVLPLTDITAESGVDWVHVSGMEGDKLLPETMGGGVAVFDYDRDGDEDLLFVGGTSWPWAKQPNANPRSLCLFENDGHAKFTDVTQQAGLDASFYGMGPCIGDFDNDGWPDIFITAVGRNRLWANVEGKFQDITLEAGVSGAEDAWSTGAVWFDYDHDGNLDLFVCDYVEWSRELDLSLGFKLTGVGRAYGQPTLFTGTQCHLFHNEGQGGFKDVSAEMGVLIENPDTGVPVGKGLGIAAIDVNEDGWQDLVVSNDTVRNFLFMNLEGKRFEESGVPMGIAFDRGGNATGAMGIDCSYFRNSEALAIAIGNFANEQSSLYVSNGPLSPFADKAMVTGLGPMSRLNLTFGMFFADLDLDTRQDLVCSNGHLEAEISKVQSTQQYEQPPQFFWNAGPTGSSEFVSLGAAEVGEAALQRMVGRGAAFGDLDGDSDLDIVLVENSGQPRILRNDQALGNHWIRLVLEGRQCNRDAIGAVVTVVAGGQTQRRVVTSTRSYLSQCEVAVTFGLGQSQAVDSLSVQWPGGELESFEGLAIDQTHLVVQGASK